MSRKISSVLKICCIMLCIVHSVAYPKSYNYSKAYQQDRLSELNEEATKSFEIGEELYRKNDYQKAIVWLTMSANYGYPIAMSRLSELYKSETQFQDYQAAYKWVLLYMLHAKATVPLNSLLQWLSLDDMENVHKEVIAWLEERNVSESTLNSVRQQLYNVMRKMEQKDFAASRMSPIYINNTMIYVAPIIIHH